MIKPKTGFAGVLERAGQVTRLVRPAPVATPPPFVKCGGCLKGGRNDQQVPDPDQFVRVKGEATEKAESDIKFTDAAPVWCPACGAWYHSIGCYSLHRHD